MPLSDRILRALFVGLAVGLAWGIRGSFGHVIGASYPGAVLGLAFCYVSGQEALRKWMPVLAAVTGILIGLGGMMSYGLLHGFAQSDTPVNYTYGLFTLFLQGGAWGIFGCATVGLMLENDRPKLWQWAVAVPAIYVFGLVVEQLLVKGAGWHVNPPRGDSLIGFTAMSGAAFVCLLFFKKRLALYAAALGFFGFGLGMCGGRVLGNISNIMQVGSLGPFTISHWNVMEVSVGLIGGFVFTYGMLGYDYPEPPEDEAYYKPLAALSMFYVVGGIPLLHRITRVSDERTAKWTEQVTAFASDPQQTIGSMQTQLSGITLIALVAAGICIFLYLKYEQQWPWLPVLALTGVMLLFQNVFSMYFIVPKTPGDVDTRTFYWFVLVAMIGYVTYQALNNGPEDLSEGIDDATDFKTWLIPLLAVASFIVCVFITGGTNGEQTMKSAATRWPVWVWNEGPFHGTNPQQPPQE